MDRLRLLLDKLEDVNWVTRPSEDEAGDEQVGPQTDIVKSEVSPVGSKGTETTPQEQSNQPINPQALNSVASDIRASTPEPSLQQEEKKSPYGQKLRHLATMGKLQNMQYPTLKPKKTLAGGDYGSGIL